MVANNFVLPAAIKTYVQARIDWNDAIQTIGQNFYGAATPGPIHVVWEGVQQNPLPNGLLFRSSKTNALYIVDSVNQKGNPVHGNNMTRVGLGHRLEETLASMNVGTYEVGELWLTMTSGNVRLYAKSTNAGAFVDVGLPVTGSITSAMLADGSLTATKFADWQITTQKLANNWQGNLITYVSDNTASQLRSGNAGYVLKSGGLNSALAWGVAQGPRSNTYTLTAASGTFTVPPGVETIEVECWGAGGGGGGGHASGMGAGGGGGGYSYKIINGLVPGGTVSYVVGTGGTRGAPGAAGGRGGNTNFGAHCNASGGTGGAAGAAYNAGGDGGFGANGNVNLSGAYGDFNNGLNYSGSGGMAARGSAGGRSNVTANGYPGIFPGGGGGGGTGGSDVGGLGANGLIIVYY